MLRLVVAAEELLVERLVRLSWLTVPAERAVEEPVLRLVVAEEVLPEERLVVLLPVERLLEPVLREVRSFCAKEEWLEEDPELRLTEGLEDRLADALEDRLVDTLAERLLEPPEEREVETEPDERLIEEDPRVVVWEEDDRAAEDPPERRDWASASGAATITKVRAIAAKMLIILFMALSF